MRRTHTYRQAHMNFDKVQRLIQFFSRIKRKICHRKLIKDAKSLIRAGERLPIASAHASQIFTSPFTYGKLSFRLYRF